MVGVKIQARESAFFSRAGMMGRSTGMSWSVGGGRKKWIMWMLVGLSLTTVIAITLRATITGVCEDKSEYRMGGLSLPLPSSPPRSHNAFDFIKSRTILLVSHELSLSGGPLLLMELAFLLRNAGAEVIWVTNQKPSQADEVTYQLESRMLDRGVQVLPAKDQETVNVALKADIVILNTAVAGKWIDNVLKEKTEDVLPKILWWIHEMRGHYFTLDYVKHLPNVAAAMIDSYTTAEYWKNRTSERLRIKMPETHVVHLGNSKELMEVAEDSVARRVLREHVRGSLGLHHEDIVFAIINSVSRGKGQDLFLHAFYESLQIIQKQRLQLPPLHALVVGSDMSAQPKFEALLRAFVKDNKIQDRVHFVNKTLNVAPYLAAIDVLVQNSQGRGECFGRITIEAMAFQLPVLGTSAGGTNEIIVNGSTGFLHPVGKDGVQPLARNIVDLSYHVERRLRMGKKGLERVKERFMEHHMAERISKVLKEVMKKSKKHP